MSLFRRSSLPVPSTKDQPGHSILLNGTSTSSSSSSSSSSKPIPTREPQHIEDAQPGLGRSYTSNASFSTSPSEAASVVSGRGRAPSVSTTGSSSTKVSFAPLPTVPPEMKRRNSITLGVAARKNLLVQQGTAPRAGPNVNMGAVPPGAGGGGSGGGGNVRQVYMTDEEWEAYKKQYEDKHASDAVDLGELATKGAKNLWRKVRSASSSSAASNASSASTADSSLAPPGAEGATLSSSPRNFFKARKRDASPAGQGAKLPMGTDELPTVEEEDRDKQSPPALTIDLGATAMNGGLGLNSTGGDSLDERANVAEVPSRGTAVLRRGSFEEWSHSPTPTTAGIRAAATAEKHELELEHDHDHDHDHEGHGPGDATPRRLVSPPPTQHLTMGRLSSPPPKRAFISDEEEDDDGDVEEYEQDDEGGDDAREQTRLGASPTSSKDNSPTAVRRRASDFAMKRRADEPAPSILGFVKTQPAETAK